MTIHYDNNGNSPHGGGLHSSSPTNNASRRMGACMVEWHEDSNNVRKDIQMEVTRGTESVQTLSRCIWHGGSISRCQFLRFHVRFQDSQFDKHNTFEWPVSSARSRSIWSILFQALPNQEVKPNNDWSGSAWNWPQGWLAAGRMIFNFNSSHTTWVQTYCTRWKVHREGVGSSQMGMDFYWAE